MLLLFGSGSAARSAAVARGRRRSRSSGRRTVFSSSLFPLAVVPLRDLALGVSFPRPDSESDTQDDDADYDRTRYSGQRRGLCHVRPGWYAAILNDEHDSQ